MSAYTDKIIEADSENLSDEQYAHAATLLAEYETAMEDARADFPDVGDVDLAHEMLLAVVQPCHDARVAAYVKRRVL